jgi:hypothetical protein
MLSEKGCIFAASAAAALACLLLPLEARAQCGGGRTQMRTMMSTSPQSGPQSGLAQSYVMLSLLQQQNALQAALQQQQQIAPPAAAAPAQQQAAKPVLKRQNEVRPQSAAPSNEAEEFAQASRQRQLAQLDDLKQKMKGATAQFPAEFASGR